MNLNVSMKAYSNILFMYNMYFFILLPFYMNILYFICYFKES